MFGFTLANFVVIIPYILAFFAMFNVELSTSMSMKEPATERAVVCEAPIDDAGEQDEVSSAAVGVVEAADKVEESQHIAPAPSEEEASADVSVGMNGFFYNVLIILGFLLGAMLWWLALTSIINLFRKGFRPRHMLTINHVAGLVIGIIGIYTLLSVLIK